MKYALVTIKYDLTTSRKSQPQLIVYTTPFPFSYFFAITNYKTRVKGNYYKLKWILIYFVGRLLLSFIFSSNLKKYIDQVRIGLAP